MSRNLKADSLAPAKGIEQLLTIRLQLVLVIHVDDEFLAVQNIRRAVGLAVVRYEPVNKSQTYIARPLEEFHDFVEIVAAAVEALEAGNNEFLLTMDLLPACLRIRSHCRRLDGCYAIHTMLEDDSGGI